MTPADRARLRALSVPALLAIAEAAEACVRDYHNRMIELPDVITRLSRALGLDKETP